MRSCFNCILMGVPCPNRQRYRGEIEGGQSWDNDNRSVSACSRS